MCQKRSHLFFNTSVGLIFGLMFLVIAVSPVWAGEKEDLEAMQKALNQEILDKPFYPGDKAAVDAYLEEAIKKGVKPIEDKPAGWAPGWTCNNLMYSFNAYRNCMHYYRYHGRYYPY